MAIGLGGGNEISSTPVEQTSNPAMVAQPQTESLFSAAYQINPSIAQNEGSAMSGAAAAGVPSAAGSYEAAGLSGQTGAGAGTGTINDATGGAASSQALTAFDSLSAQNQAAVAAMLPQADLVALVNAMPAQDQSVIASAVDSSGNISQQGLQNAFLQIADTSPSDIATAAQAIPQADLLNVLQQIASNGTVSGGDAAAGTGAAGTANGAGSTGLDGSAGSGTALGTAPGASGSGSMDAGAGSGAGGSPSGTGAAQGSDATAGGAPAAAPSADANQAVQEFQKLSPQQQALVIANLPQSTDMPAFIQALPAADQQFLQNDLGSNQNITIKDLYNAFSQIGQQSPGDLATAAAAVNPNDLQSLVQQAEQQGTGGAAANKGDASSKSSAGDASANSSGGLFTMKNLAIGGTVAVGGLYAAHKYGVSHPESSVAKLFKFHRASPDAVPGDLASAQDLTGAAGASGASGAGTIESLIGSEAKLSPVTAGEPIQEALPGFDTSLGVSSTLSGGLDAGAKGIEDLGAGAQALGIAKDVVTVAEDAPK